MRILLYFIFFQSIVGISQESVINELNTIFKNKEPEKAFKYFTHEYWNTDFDGTDSKQIFTFCCSPYHSGLFRTIDKIKNKKRSVFKVQFYSDSNTSKDLIYVFFVKRKNKWLIDGMSNNTKVISAFLSDKCSGHFNYLEIPKSEKIKKIGLNIIDIALNKNELILNDYLSKYFNTNSLISYTYISNFLIKQKIKGIYLLNSRYHKKLKQGFLGFEIYIDQNNDFFEKNVMTFYFTKIKNKFSIYLTSKNNKLLITPHFNNENPFKKDKVIETENAK